MKVRDSGMPEEGWWSTFFDPERILRLFGLDGEAGDVVEFGCGYGTFTLPAARLVSGTVHALDIEPALVELVKERCAREGIDNVRAEVLDFVVEGTGLPPHSVCVALLFNILHHEEPVALMEEAFRVLIPGGHLAVIHWNYDPGTPRGPALEIRPRPEQCIEWGREAGFSFDERERLDLKPHHFGLRFRKPAGLRKDRRGIGISTKSYGGGPMKKIYDLSTRCVHAGEAKDAEGSPHTPIYNTTTFGFRSTADLLDVVEGRRPGNLYTRYGLNPTIRSVEVKLASLENAESALVFASGMAAEAALFFAHGRKGIVCLGNAYGGTLALLTDHLPLVGIPTFLLLGDEVGNLEEVLKQGPGLVFFETPTNPTMEIFDIREISRLSHSYGALVAVDNTFASPINQQVLALGADIAVHSATKYLGGHSDLTGGALMGSKEHIEPVAPWRKNLGQMMAPEVAGLLSRSLRTLPIRVERQNRTAQAVAEAMRNHPKVARVLYPGLPGFPQHALAGAQMSGFGGMLTLEVKGSGEDATKVVDGLELIIIAPSLGGPESLATQPMTTTHHGLTPEERLKRGITDSMIRFSIGMEAAEDLIEDLNNALENV